MSLVVLSLKVTIEAEYKMIYDASRNSKRDYTIMNYIKLRNTFFTKHTSFTITLNFIGAHHIYISSIKYKLISGYSALINKISSRKRRRNRELY